MVAAGHNYQILSTTQKSPGLSPERKIRLVMTKSKGRIQLSLEPTGTVILIKATLVSTNQKPAERLFHRYISSITPSRIF